jgi:hypothetical protein
MLKLFTKKWIFSFLASFFVTFIAGFFIWNIFISPGNGFLDDVLAEVDRISSNFFTASISQSPKSENTIPKDNKSLEPDKNLLNSVNSVNIETEEKNQIVMSEADIRDQLDDIQEKLDIIKKQVVDLLPEDPEEIEQVQNLEGQKLDEQKIEDKKTEEKIDKKDENIIIADNEKPKSYPKILISEVQSAGIGDDKQEFVELYNPNNVDVDLTGWYLQRKTSSSSDFSTYASNNLFSVKKISANGYFLIARTGYYQNFADIFTENPITDNNSFALKNPNGDINDEILLPEIPAGASFGRELNTENFELQTPTPKANNIKYFVPPPASGGGGGGGSPELKIYPKILISEVQILPIDKRFIELYNPNDSEVNLTDWYLQRKTSTSDSFSSSVSSTKFSGKTISSNSYFIISRELADSDILFDLTLSPDNSLALKNPNGDISDKLGFGGALDFELLATVSPGSEQSIGRKWDLENNIEKDTDDNSADFELQTPTPKVQNIAYVEPPPSTLQSIEVTIPATKLVYNVGDALDIFGLVVTGTYSDESELIMPITLENVSGFDSVSPSNAQVLTIIIEEKTTTYLVDIIENPVEPSPPPPAPADTTPPSIITYTISNLIITPENNTTIIDLAFSERVKANVDILDSSGVVIVNDFYKSSGVTNPHAKTWYGNNSDDETGAVVEDGVYTIKIVISDEAENTTIDTSRTITVNNVAT